MVVDGPRRPASPTARDAADRRQAGYRPRPMNVSSTDRHAADSDGDTVAIGVFEGEQPAAGFPAELAQLLDSGEARRSFKALALTHADARRWLLVGLGSRA